MILENDSQNSLFANFLQKLTACCGDLTHFEQQISHLLQIVSLPVDKLVIDHLAVRMNTLSVAQEWMALLQSQAQLLKQSEINGRPIAIFDLVQPLSFLGQSVSLIELPFPKNKIYPIQGWEHIELVYPMQNGETHLDWIERTLNDFNIKDNPHIQWKVSQPQVIGERLPNPTIALSLKEKANLCSVKLHPFHLALICQSEIEH